MSIFSRSLPWPTVLRVWDMFFFEGMKVQFKVALALLNLTFSRPQIREECPRYSHYDQQWCIASCYLFCSFIEVTRKLKNLPSEVTHEEVLIPEVTTSYRHTALYSCC